MSGDQDKLKTRIRRFGPRQLLSLLDRVEKRDVSLADWPAGKAFEYAVVRAFEIEAKRSKRAHVEYPFVVPESGDAGNGGGALEQIDGIVYFDGIGCLLESKDHEDSVSYKEIAKLESALRRRPALTIGALFSTAGFTEPAKILTQRALPRTILLWELKEIIHATRRGMMLDGLRKKLRMAMKLGAIDWSLVPTGRLS
ncbi:MAG: restriction endonuclease [Planctomycetes bacterium]|nr:restriction endonuclease [Planctomycetota bacterium]